LSFYYFSSCSTTTNNQENQNVDINDIVDTSEDKKDTTALSLDDSGFDEDLEIEKEANNAVAEVFEGIRDSTHMDTEDTATLSFDDLGIKEELEEAIVYSGLY
jgi:hypothetical protein